jgi:sugar transferase (PEP-CTERM/EpsH1 system associated)
VTRRIRIAHVVFRFDCGGLQNGMVNIMAGLPADEFQHTVVSLTDSTDFRRRLPDNVALAELGKPPGKSPAYLYQVWKMLRSGRFDIVHTRNLPCLESQLAGLVAGVPVRVHGEHGWDVFDLDGSRRGYRWLRRAFSLIVDRYVVVSAELGAFLRDRIGIAGRRIVRICNGVDTEKFRPAEDGLPTRPFVVGSVGRLEAVKDYGSLAAAFAALPPGEASRLVIVGDGSERSRLQAWLADRGLAASSSLAGASDDVAALMRGFSVFVLPSLAEGISNTILEAMATGLPVIATRVGGNAELVVDGETGFLVPPRDPSAIAERLAYYRSHPDVLARHGRAARQRALAHFSLEVMVRQYRDFYRDCARG